MRTALRKSDCADDVEIIVPDRWTAEALQRIVQIRVNHSAVVSASSGEVFIARVSMFWKKFYGETHVSIGNRT